jgi:hypothetical protein
VAMPLQGAAEEAHRRRGADRLPRGRRRAPFISDLAATKYSRARAGHYAARDSAECFTTARSCYDRRLPPPSDGARAGVMRITAENFQERRMRRELQRRRMKKFRPDNFARRKRHRRVVRKSGCAKHITATKFTPPPLSAESYITVQWSQM